MSDKEIKKEKDKEIKKETINFKSGARVEIETKELKKTPLLEEDLDIVRHNTAKLIGLEEKVHSLNTKELSRKKQCYRLKRTTGNKKTQSPYGGFGYYKNRVYDYEVVQAFIIQYEPTTADLASFLNMTHTSYYRAMNPRFENHYNPELKEAIQEAYKYIALKYVEKAERKLFERLSGYMVTEHIKETVYDRDNNVKETRVREVQKIIPPDMKAIERVLDALSPRYRKKDNSNTKNTVNINNISNSNTPYTINVIPAGQSNNDSEIIEIKPTTIEESNN